MCDVLIITVGQNHRYNTRGFISVKVEEDHAHFGAVTHFMTGSLALACANPLRHEHVAMGTCRVPWKPL